MSLGRITQPTEIPLAALQAATASRPRKTDGENERSVDIAMIRIMLKKRPAEFRKIAIEAFGEFARKS
ncbi:MAG: hypothetical protein ABIR33_09500 [Pyrinomonadaceae bacterium]